MSAPGGLRATTEPTDEPRPRRSPRHRRPLRRRPRPSRPRRSRRAPSSSTRPPSTAAPPRRPTTHDDPEPPTKPPVTTTTRPSTSTTTPDGGAIRHRYHAHRDPSRGDLRQPRLDRGNEGLGRVGQQAQRHRRAQDPARRVRDAVTDAVEVGGRGEDRLRPRTSRSSGRSPSADDNTTELERCGIPDLPARTISDEHGRAVNTFAVVPDPGHEPARRRLQVAPRPGRHLLRAVRHPADRPGPQDAAMQHVEAANSVGFTLVDTTELTDDATQADYAPAVQAIQRQAGEPRMEPPRLQLDGEPSQGGGGEGRHRREARGSASTSATRTRSSPTAGRRSTANTSRSR